MLKNLHRLKRRFFSNIALARVSIITLVLLVAVALWYLLHGFVGTSLQLVTGKPLPQASGRTNLVLLGSGGQGHAGPDLTDTVILVSIKLETGETSLISIPRDFWIPSLRAKINTAFHYGFAKQSTTGGLQLARSAVSESLGVPVHFALLVDFSSFVTAIDILGGVDITVDRSFTDDQYPIPGKEDDLCSGDPATKCRYETLQFDAGPQHMDGLTALKFVRSRHSSSPEEGTDFARSKRQEKVISAVRSNLLTVKNLKNSEVYKDLYALAQQSVITDITPEYYSSFFQLSLKMRKTPFKTYSIEDYLENPPVSSRYDLQWVLVPKNADSRSLLNFVSSVLN